MSSVLFNSFHLTVKICISKQYICAHQINFHLLILKTIQSTYNKTTQGDTINSMLVGRQS